MTSDRATVAAERSGGEHRPGPVAAFVYDPQLANISLPHAHGREHPLRPLRVRYTYELLDAYGAFGGGKAELRRPQPADEADLLTVHTRAYVNAVRQLSSGRALADMARYGFEPSNLLPFRSMYEWALLTVGATLLASHLVVSEHRRVAFSPAGGVNHHAHRSRSHGFGIFNDAAIAIARLRAQGLRVAYVDIDLHHGDGVEAAFADTDQVLTISLHESTDVIFPGPGSGSVDQIGHGRGRGFAVNVPLAPYTDDDTYLWAFRQIVPPLLTVFSPDVVVAQLGVDTHYTDPLWPWHLALTTRGYQQTVRELSALAHRWIAIGGGGYDVFAVARCWTLAFGVMSDLEFSNDIPEVFRQQYCVRQLHDSIGPALETTEVERAREYAESVVAQLKRAVFPLHGL